MVSGLGFQIISTKPLFLVIHRAVNFCFCGGHDARYQTSMGTGEQNTNRLLANTSTAAVEVYERTTTPTPTPQHMYMYEDTRLPNALDRLITLMTIT